MLPAAGRAAVARHQVRAGGRSDRRLRGSRGLARPPQDARGRRCRAVAVLCRPLRRRERGGLRWADAVRGGCAGRHRDRRLVPRRLPRALVPTGGAVHRPQLRAAALGSGVRAGIRRAVVAVALPSRAGSASRAGRARDRGDRRPLRRRARRPGARRRVLGAHHVRVLVPAAAPAGRAAARRATGGVGPAAYAAGRRGAGGAHPDFLRVALRRRALGRRLAGSRSPGCPIRPAHRSAAAVHA